MPELFDVIELTVDIPGKGLRAGLQGTVVHCHDDGKYEVEFANEHGETTDLLVLASDQFIVVWQAKTKQWVSIEEKIGSLVANLPEGSAMEVLNFARYQSVRTREHIAAVSR